MKKWKKILLTLFIVVLIAGLCVFYYATKKPATAADSKPVKEMTAAELFNSLDSNFHVTDSLYKDKNIAVTGVIKEIDIANKHIFIQGGEGKLVNCSFDSTEFVKVNASLKTGANVNIKGIYSGSDGYDNKDDGMDLIPSDKIVQLKTCSPNN